LDRLAELAAEDPAGWAFATGTDAGVFVAEMEGELATNAFNGLIALGISGLLEEETDWQTLSAGVGRRTFAIYIYPAGMTLRRNGKHPALGLTIHANGGYVLLPLDFDFLDPDMSIAPSPQLLLDFAFVGVSNEASSQLARRIAPQRADSRFLPNNRNPDAGSQMWSADRNTSTVSGNGWRGTVRISRRS
jgi:hypothetical protein